MLISKEGVKEKAFKAANYPGGMAEWEQTGFPIEGTELEKPWTNPVPRPASGPSRPRRK